MVDAPRLTLLGGFRLAMGDEPVAISMGAQRVLVFVALQDRPVLRSYVGANLWLDATEAQASANLRSALWKLGPRGTSFVHVAGGMLSGTASDGRRVGSLRSPASAIRA